jgi:hypothetical protein
MTKRYWVVGGEYEAADFRALVPGTGTMAGPFEDEATARTVWTRLSRCPERSRLATLRYSIAAECVH